MNKKAIVKSNYTVLELDEDGGVTDDSGAIETSVDQYKDEVLEVWKVRDDGFYFVYSESLTVGYWVHPDLIVLTN